MTAELTRRLPTIVFEVGRSDLKRMRNAITLFTLIISSSTLSGCDWSREVMLLDKSGLNISRYSVEKVFSEEISIRFGAKGRSKMGFRLPEDVSGLEACDTTRGFGVIEAFEFPEANIELQDGCQKRIAAEPGTDFIYTLFDDHIFITVYF